MKKQTPQPEENKIKSELPDADDCAPEKLGDKGPDPILDTVKTPGVIPPANASDMRQKMVEQNRKNRKA